MTAKISAIRPILVPLTLALLAACGGVPPDPSPDRNDQVANNRELGPPFAPEGPMPSSVGDGPPDAGPRSCTASIGAAAAAELVDQCRSVSPATRPPCNAANSCAMIEDEIARSCALFDDGEAQAAGCSPMPRSAAAAAAVVTRYYAAIDARDYGTAWQQWGNDGQPGRSFAAFELGFADTSATTVAIGADVSVEGGAGSLYATVPVTVDARRADGSRQRFRGSYIVRRVNDVDGASAESLRWHLDSAKLEPVR